MSDPKLPGAGVAEAVTEEERKMATKAASRFYLPLESLFNNQLAQSLSAAGDASGERVWRMPMYDEYHDDMQSDIADIKNLSEKPYAGSITAAKFLEIFTNEHPAWVHLDIAGMCFQPNGYGKGYCATGYGVRLLLKWMSLESP